MHGQSTQTRVCKQGMQLERFPVEAIRPSRAGRPEDGRSDNRCSTAFPIAPMPHWDCHSEQRVGSEEAVLLLPGRSSLFAELESDSYALNITSRDNKQSEKDGTLPGPLRRYGNFMRPLRGSNLGFPFQCIIQPLAAFFGLPPMRPLALAAARLAAVLDLPPASPILDAIHRLDPKNPSRRLGR